MRQELARPRFQALVRNAALGAKLEAAAAAKEKGLLGLTGDANKDGPGGRMLADAVETSHCPSLLVDASRNAAMAYHDVVRIRLSNNRKKALAGDNPLDGAKKADRFLS